MIYDIIDTISKLTGVMLVGEDGIEYPEMEQVPGYFVNVLPPLNDVLGTDGGLIPNPLLGFIYAEEVQIRGFGGRDDTIHLRFTDRDEWLSMGVEKEEGDTSLDIYYEGELAKQVEDKAKAYLVAVVEGLVQSEIAKYNEANGVIFQSVYNCVAYMGVEGYSHQPFCISIVKYNADVWDAARAIEVAVLGGSRAMPTAKELLTELPVYVG